MVGLTRFDAIIILLANPVHSARGKRRSDDLRCYHGGPTLRAGAGGSCISLLKKAGPRGLAQFLCHDPGSPYRSLGFWCIYKKPCPTRTRIGHGVKTDILLAKSRMSRTKIVRSSLTSEILLAEMQGPRERFRFAGDWQERKVDQASRAISTWVTSRSASSIYVLMRATSDFSFRRMASRVTPN